MRKPAWLEELDHTADEGIIVQAATMPELFERAAWGMFSLIADLDTVQPVTRDTIAVEAGDVEALMVRWLSELVFQHEYTRFENLDAVHADSEAPR